MKKYLIIFMLLLVATVGCQKAELGGGTFEDGLTMEMSFTTDPSGTDPELVNAIANMRIFLFDSADKKLKYAITNIKKKEDVANTVIFELPIGVWNIVGLSNLESKKINFDMEFGKTKEQLLHTFAYSATGNGVVASTADKGANCSEIVSFSILDKEIKESTSSTNLGTLSFKRMVGKVTLAIVGYTGSIKPSGKHEVEIIGIPTKLSFDGSLLTSKLKPSRLAPQMLKTTSEKMIRKMTIDTSDPAKNKSTFIIPAWHDYDGGMDGKGNNKLGIRIKLEKTDGRFYEKTLLAKDMPSGLAANRELYVAITAKAAIEIENTILPWTPAEVDGDIGGSQLIAPSEVIMAQYLFCDNFSTKDIVVTGRKDISLAYKNTTEGSYTNIPYDATSGIAIELPDRPSWLTAGNFTVSNKKSMRFNFTYVVENTTNKQPYYIRIKSGNITKEMKVIYGTFQVFGTRTQIPTVIDYWTYVGAFWKASQKGERFIRIANPSVNQSWSARVVPCDWSSDILLQNYNGELRGDITPAESTNIDTPAISGGSQSITGSGDIKFRIGLKSYHANGNTKPRYARVVIQYDNDSKHQYIYLRQGETPDYIMRPEDNNDKNNITTEWGGTTSRPRPLATEWAVYNLTAPTLKNGTATGGTNAIDNTQHPLVEFKGAVFVDYPTQVGAFWQNMVPDTGHDIYKRRAYYPVNLDVIESWNMTDNFEEYWKKLKNTQEVSPRGYRRPTDGTIDNINNTAKVADSEMRQSIWLDGISSVVNSDFGYYADGFFDRLDIVDAPSYYSLKKSSVSANNNEIAYICRLFFNKNTQGSLAFPASGYLYPHSGTLHYAGDSGYYWSGSLLSTQYGWYLNFGSTHSHQSNSLRSIGFVIRPVVDK